MPLTTSAIKKLKQDKKRKSQNLLVKKNAKEAVKAFKKKPNSELLSKAFQALDTASKKNVYHRNKSARLKSRLSKLLEKGLKKAPVKVEKTEKKKTSKKTKKPTVRKASK